MKKTAVVFSSSKAYSIGCCINIMALEEKSPDLADKYIVYCDSWDKEIMDKLKNFTDKVEFIEYTQEMFENNYLKQCDSKVQEIILNFIKRYTYFPILRGEMLLLLRNFNQIIYMGCDFIILDDISELKKLDNVAWRGGATVYPYKGENLNRPNGDLLIFPDTIPYEELSKKYFDYFLSTLFDETALCAIMHDYNIDVINLPGDYNYGTHVMDLIKIQNNIKILHTVGSSKIWNSDLLRCICPEYVKYLDYFGYKCTNDKDVVCSRDDFIQNVLKMRGVISMPLIEIYDPNVHMEIIGGVAVYRYKKYKTFYFRGRRMSNDIFRIYFQVKNESSVGLINYIMNFTSNLAILDISKESHTHTDTRILNYRLCSYSDDDKVFYCDCNKQNLTQNFNKMISDFKYVIDLFFDDHVDEKNKPLINENIKNIEASINSANKLIENHIQTMNKKLDDLSLKSDKAEKEINAANTRIKELEAEKEALRRRIIEMQNSRSWRYTRMFRKNKKDDIV